MGVFALDGKLSTEDFTTEEKTKLGNLNIIDLGYKTLEQLEQYVTDNHYAVNLYSNGSREYVIMSVKDSIYQIYQTFFLLRKFISYDGEDVL